MTPLKDVDCPSCDSAGTLELIRSDTAGRKWAVCTACAKTVLLDAKNRVLHTGT